MDIREVFKVADLAERYHLPGLMAKTVQFAKNLRFPSEDMMEIFILAEEFHVFKELSETLKANIADFLVTVIQTPEDLNDHYEDFLGRTNEESIIGLRMLALIDHRDLVYVDQGFEARQRHEVISHIRHIERSIQPRKHLQQLRDIIESFEQGNGDPWMDEHQQDPGLMELIIEHGRWNEDNQHFAIESLKVCSVLDAEKAAEKGVLLTLDTLVEDNCTHGMSVKLHLEVIFQTFGPCLYWENRLEDIWNVLEKSIPQVQTIILIWLNETFLRIDADAKMKLMEKLRSYGREEAFRTLPGFNSLFDRMIFD